METYFHKGSVLKHIKEGVLFCKHFAIGKTGHVVADSGFHQSCWRNKTCGVDFASPVGETGDTWCISSFSLVKYFWLYENYRLQMVVTFDRNVRLRPIICQNVRNWKRNPLTIVERNLVNWFFQKTPLSRWKIGFKIQSPDFSKSFKFCYSIIMEKSGDWILNPIFHLFRGVFGKISWPNPLWEFLEDSFFNFEHFDILWASNGHFY